MKFYSVLITLALSGLAFAARAEVVRKTLTDVQVRVFDATCVPASDSEGYLKVDLEAEKRSESFFVAGSFFSYSPSTAKVDSQRWHLLPLAECQEAQADLAQKVGRKITLNARSFEEAYEMSEEVWGQCRGSIREGRETFPCRKGTRRVTRVHREVVFDLGHVFILYKNN